MTTPRQRALRLRRELTQPAMRIQRFVIGSPFSMKEVSALALSCWRTAELKDDILQLTVEIGGIQQYVWTSFKAFDADYDFITPEVRRELHFTYEVEQREGGRRVMKLTGVIISDPHGKLKHIKCFGSREDLEAASR